MDLGISINPTPELYTIKVTGEIDISNADSLRNAIDLALEQPTAPRLDVSRARTAPFGRNSSIHSVKYSARTPKRPSASQTYAKRHALLGAKIMQR